MREAIVKELVGAVKEIAGSGYSVTAQETTKNNGVKMLGIEIRKPEETVVRLRKGEFTVRHEIGLEEK